MNHSPQALGIIMDGNRRWAEKRGLKPWEGHRAGVETFRKTLEWLSDTDVEHVAYYAFSSENWKRPEEEVHELIKLFGELLDSSREDFLNRKIRVRFIGNLKKLPSNLQKEIRVLEQETQAFSRTVWICLSYGGRDEILHAASRVSSYFGRFSSNLWSADMPDIDVVIRTGGAHRLSNFLLWKCAYAELCFTDTLWPDLEREEFLNMINRGSGASKNLGA